MTARGEKTEKLFTEAGYPKGTIIESKGFFYETKVDHGKITLKLSLDFDAQDLLTLAKATDEAATRVQKTKKLIDAGFYTVNGIGFLSPWAKRVTEPKAIPIWTERVNKMVNKLNSGLSYTVLESYRASGAAYVPWDVKNERPAENAIYFRDCFTTFS